MQDLIGETAPEAKGLWDNTAFPWLGGGDDAESTAVCALRLVIDGVMEEAQAATARGAETGTGGGPAAKAEGGESDVIDMAGAVRAQHQEQRQQPASASSTTTPTAAAPQDQGPAGDASASAAAAAAVEHANGGHGGGDVEALRAALATEKALREASEAAREAERAEKEALRVENARLKAEQRVRDLAESVAAQLLLLPEEAEGRREAAARSGR